MEVDATFAVRSQIRVSDQSRQMRPADEHAIRLLIESYVTGMEIVPVSGQAATINPLVGETIRYRDRLQADHKLVVAMRDVQAAVDGLDETVRTGTPPGGLNDISRPLAQLLHDHLTMFRQS